MLLYIVLLSQDFLYSSLQELVIHMRTRDQWQEGQVEYGTILCFGTKDVNVLE